MEHVDGFCTVPSANINLLELEHPAKEEDRSLLPAKSWSHVSTASLVLYLFPVLN
jgi:hypothetical protein